MAADQENVIITFQESADLQLLKESGVEVQQVFKTIPAVSASVTQEEKAALQTDPSVKWIETDYEVRVQSQTASAPYKRVQAHTSKAAGWTGKGVKIAVIDTGINGRHPEITLAGGVSFIQNSPYDVDLFGHGTHVAGIIAAADNDIGIIGVAPNAELYAVKALGNDGYGTETSIIAGVEWAIENKMDIINLSLTSGNSTKAMEEVLKKADRNGIIVVAAAGNLEDLDEQFTDVLFPARYDSVIAVCSLENNLERSIFSYYGPNLDVCAPGSNIYSTFSDPETETDEDYGYGSGTSVAAPFVTGVLALYKEAYPQMDHRQIRKLMQLNALPLGKGGKNNQYGYGLVQAPGKVLSSFIDVRTDAWYSNGIHYLSAAAIIIGYPDSTFKPNGKVTRAEAVTMIGKALKLDANSTGNSFTDVKAGHFAESYIKAAVKRGIVTGYPDGTFRPNESITRGEVAVMIQRAFQYEETKTAAFTDVKQSAYYFTAVNALKNANITTGYPEDNTYRPANSITRAEYAIFVARALKAIN